MQPQGLEALMQSQPAPQMNNPRLAAAMDVVTSDAEEQILDPRTLAMLKYKDALQAMQAADQMMAAAQPVPTAPTVAERTKLAAEQGIAGLAQRLSPGVQQQGRQMAAQQAQQAMQGGGLPQLPAPNMAGMAGGGIVGYADGGAPTPTKVVPRPVPMGQPNVGAQAAVSDDVARYIYNYTNLRSSMEAATDPQQKAVINQRLQEMQRTFSPDIVSEAHMKMSQQSGMAGGGIVAFAGEDGSAVKKPPKATSLRREQELVDAGVPPDEARRISREEMYQGMGELAVPTLLTALDTPRRVITEVVPGAIADAYRGAAGVFRRNVEDPARAMFEGATRGGGEPTTAEEIAALYPDSTTTTPAAQEASPSTGTVNLSRLDKLFPKREPAPAPSTAPVASSNPYRDALQARVASQQGPDLNVGIASPPTNAAREELLALNRGRSAEDAGSRYRELTGMEDAIKERRVEQDRLRALQEARFSPEQERSRLLRAGLAGLASRGFGGFSSGIAGEEEIIAGERDTAQQRVIADMDKTIAELRALGLGQFEAEQAAAQIHSTQLAQLAELEQNEQLADRASRERGESENRADIRSLAGLEQDMTIAEMEDAFRYENLSAERTAALEAAVNEAAVRNSMTPQQVLTIAQRIVADDLTGTKTLAAAVQEVRDVAAGRGDGSGGANPLSSRSDEDILNALRGQ